jgi:GT2 family glycosyltransferase
MVPPIFLTGRFRSGSTLLWNIFRQLDGVVAYYEPLHPKLPHYLKHPPAPQSRHFHVTSYFDEYASLDGIGQYHSSEFGVSRLRLEAEEDHPRLEAYLRYVVASAGENRVPVLKFNRIDFRLPWIRARFPQARLIHLYRSPRDQWVSLLRAAAEGPDPDLEADPFHLTTWSRDLCAVFPFLATHELRHLYQRHYYLWKLSYLAGSRIADLSISYEALLDSPRETLSRLLEAVSLRTDEAVETCLRVLVASPQGAWRSYRHDAWFEELEGECEARLDELGLNTNFGLRCVSEIIASNHVYRQMVADPRAGGWALRSAQVAVTGMDVICDEKERVLQELARAAEERRVELERTRAQSATHLDALERTARALEKRAESAEAAAEARLRVIEEQERTACALEKRAQNAEAAAEARLLVIDEQERALGAYRGRSLREWARRLLAPRLGVLYQHPPRPLRIPAHYPRLSPPSPCPTVSLVTPSLNQGGFIRRTVESVLDQAYPRLEYVVQDGGSSDGTLAILEQTQGRLRYKSGADGGQANAVNRGFAQTSGEIMAYLNADDLLLPGALNCVGRFFSRHPEVDVVYGHRIVIDEYDQEIGRWVLPRHDDAVLTFADYVPQETLFWRRGIWERVGGHLDETFHFALDWDLLLRFREAGALFVRLPRFLGAFRVHPHQKTSAEMATRGKEEMDRLRRRCHGRSLGPAEVHRQVRSYLVRHTLLHKLYRCGLVRY